MIKNKHSFLDVEAGHQLIKNGHQLTALCRVARGEVWQRRNNGKFIGAGDKSLDSLFKAALVCVDIAYALPDCEDYLPVVLTASGEQLLKVIRSKHRGPAPAKGLIYGGGNV